VTRYCGNCGTEVDDSAIFCPTCGQPIDQAVETEIPAAPGWPDAPAAAPRGDEPIQEPMRPPAQDAGWTARAPEEPQWAAPPPVASGWDQPAAEAPTRVEERVPPPPAVPPAMPPAPSRAQQPPQSPAERAATGSGAPGPAANLPITTPVTLSGWLVGIGAVLGALGVLIGVFDGQVNPIELVLLVALLAIAATVFFSANLPDIPNLRLATLVVVLIGFGIALDRLSVGRAGAGELLLFLGTAAAAIGGILLETGHDQPLGGAAG
jgi:hypothetical protein